MPLSKEQFYTIEDIYNLPDGERAELINGRIYYMAPPSTKHQRLVGRIYNVISDYIRKNNGVCEPFIAPFAVFLNGDDKNYVEPDISVICDKSKLTDKGCFGSPDWIIEIISPSSVKHDYVTKSYMYCNAGVKEYWIVDPLRNYITVHNFELNETMIYTFNDTVKVNIYENLYINLSDIAE